MFLSVVAKYIRLSLYVIMLHISEAMQYKTNFILQILGMFINDSALTLIWIIFFKQFPSINGWRFEDTALLLGIAWTSFTISGIFFFGIIDMARLIYQGNLDQYLLLPKSIIWQIASSKCNFSDIGTFLISFYMLKTSGYITLYKIPLLIFLILVITVIIFNFLLIINTCGFYFGNFGYAVDKLIKTLFDLIYFPQNIFTGILKIVMITIIPAFFIGTIPMQLIQDFKFNLFILLIFFIIIQTIFAYLFFKNGLKKYESGNLINLKI